MPRLPVQSKIDNQYHEDRWECDGAECPSEIEIKLCDRTVTDDMFVRAATATGWLLVKNRKKRLLCPRCAAAFDAQRKKAKQ